METEALNWFSPIAKSPMGYLTIAITIVLGYLLRAWPKFPNELIPHSCVVLGGLVFSVLGDRALVPDTVPLGAGRTVALICYGAVLGFVAFLLHHLVIRKIEDKIKGPAVPLMCLAPLTLIGCANFSTTQTDISYDPETKFTRTITTRATATTLLESKSALANFKASQTDKTQGASVGALNQESGGTNVASNAAALADLLRALNGK